MAAAAPPNDGPRSGAPALHLAARGAALWMHNRIPESLGRFLIQ